MSYSMIGECVRKKVRKKPFLHNFQRASCMYDSSLSLACHPLAQHLQQSGRPYMLEFYYTSCYLSTFYLSLLRLIREANVRNTNQFQCYLNVLRSFFPLSLSLIFISNVALAVDFAPSAHISALTSHSISIQSQSICDQQCVDY